MVKHRYLLLFLIIILLTTTASAVTVVDTGNWYNTSITAFVNEGDSEIATWGIFDLSDQVDPSVYNFKVSSFSSLVIYEGITNFDGSEGITNVSTPLSTTDYLSTGVYFTTGSLTGLTPSGATFSETSNALYSIYNFSEPYLSVNSSKSTGLPNSNMFQELASLEIEGYPVIFHYDSFLATTNAYYYFNGSWFNEPSLLNGYYNYDLSEIGYFNIDGVDYIYDGSNAQLFFWNNSSWNIANDYYLGLPDLDISYSQFIEIDGLLVCINKYAFLGTYSGHYLDESTHQWIQNDSLVNGLGSFVQSFDQNFAVYLDSGVPTFLMTSSTEFVFKYFWNGAEWVSDFTNPVGFKSGTDSLIVDLDLDDGLISVVYLDPMSGSILKVFEGGSTEVPAEPVISSGGGSSSNSISISSSSSTNIVPEKEIIIKEKQFLFLIIIVVVLFYYFNKQTSVRKKSKKKIVARGKSRR